MDPSPVGNDSRSSLRYLRNGEDEHSVSESDKPDRASLFHSLISTIPQSLLIPVSGTQERLSALLLPVCLRRGLSRCKAYTL